MSNPNIDNSELFNMFVIHVGIFLPRIRRAFCLGGIYCKSVRSVQLSCQQHKLIYKPTGICISQFRISSRPYATRVNNTNVNQGASCF